MPDSFTLNINGKAHTVQVDGDVPLLWVIRETLQLTGTKFGCGIAQCGACTVHVDGQPMRSCQLQVSRVVGRQITTIEGDSARSSSEAGLDRCAGPPVRLLPVGTDHVGSGPGGGKLQSQRGGDHPRPWTAICAAVEPTCASSGPSGRRPRR